MDREVKIKLLRLFYIIDNDQLHLLNDSIVFDKKLSGY